MKLTDELKSLLIDTAKQLKGSARRQFMARTAKALGPGGGDCIKRRERLGQAASSVAATGMFASNQGEQAGHAYLW